jgi:hypothetical protein
MITFRKPVEADKPIIANWILSDSEHSEKGMTPEFFFQEHTIGMVIGDLSGPGLYIRMDSEPPSSVRLHIQFSDNEVRSGKTLLKAWPEFRTRVAAAGVKRIVFESVSPRLIGFCKRCFGFTKAQGDDYELILR